MIISMFIVVCFFSDMRANCYEHTSKNRIKEYELAVEISKKFHEGILTREEAIEILQSAFRDFSVDNDKFVTIDHFIQKLTHIRDPIVHRNLEQRGWSGCEVYAVRRDNDKAPEFFLKIFPFDSKHFLPEIFGLSYLREIKEVGYPVVSGCGQCMINGDRFFLILETPVKGMSIQHYYRRVGNQPIDSNERKQAFWDLCEAVHACGMGLAKFHQHIPHKNELLPCDAEKSLRVDLTSAVEQLIIQPYEGLEINHLKDYTEYVLQKMKMEKHLLGITFDDVKTVHTFYDLETKEFSFVNPDRVYLSLDSTGNVQGLLTKDVCKFLLSLTLNQYKYHLGENHHVSRKQLLTDEEVCLVRDMFEAGYLQEGGILPDPIEKEYVFLQHNLFFIKNMHRELPEPEFTRVKDLINLSLENLKYNINEWLLITQQQCKEN